MRHAKFQHKKPEGICGAVGFMDITATDFNPNLMWCGLRTGHTGNHLCQCGCGREWKAVLNELLPPGASLARLVDRTTEVP